MNRVELADCLDGMAGLADGSVDLIYLDPPFFTGRTHRNTTRQGNKDYAFDDVWSGREAYAEFIYERMVEAARALKPTGSLFFHCDQNASHIVRAILDSIFGAENFQSEIVWSYKRWSNSKKGLLQQHQTILFYSKTSNFKWNEKRRNYSPTTNVDQILQQRARDDRGKSVYKRDSHGSIVIGAEKKGVPLGDVWEIPFLNPKAKERTGYPTQKPLELLDLIIELTTDEGDTVLDPFAGSGTTLVSASLLGRSYIGFDISQDAVNLARQRIAAPVRSSSQLVKKGVAAYLNEDPWVDGHLLGLDYDRVQRNAGIDAILRSQIDGRTVCVRVQRANETLAQAAASARSALARKPGCLFVLIQTSGEAFVPPEPSLTVLASPSLQLKRMQIGEGLESRPTLKAV